MPTSKIDNEIGEQHLPGPSVSLATIFRFVLTCLLPLAFLWRSMILLATLVRDDNTFSQIPLIPLVAAYLIYDRRRLIFAQTSSSWIAAIALMIPGSLILIGTGIGFLRLSTTNTLSAVMFGIVL